MELEQLTKRHFPLRLSRFLLLALFVAFYSHAIGQVTNPADTSQTNITRKQEKPVVRPGADLSKQYDFGDLLNDVVRPKRKADSTRKRSAITVVPNIAANPTIGFQFGVKAVAGKVLGNVPGTFMSVAATSASITTKGIIYFYFNHNIFTPGNKWNLQGSIVASKSVTPDFGLGIGRESDITPEDKILTNAARKPYVWHSQYYKFFEKVYKQLSPSLFLGAGVEVETRQNISNEKYDSILTPYKIYNERFGFPQDHYVASGFLFNIQYTTRDNPNRAYKGVYIDGGFRVNQTWVGSSRNSLQFTYDFRKYFSLSKRTPEHVLAFWSWGSGVVAGAVPYLELPGTTRDPAFRSGRGYTAGYFKSSQFFYSETEYRFPITRNKLFSGVVFANIESSNDKSGTALFEVWQPAAGGGLRILFNKQTRTNLCLDYAWGRYGAKGFFLNLNETF